MPAPETAQPEGYRPQSPDTDEAAERYLFERLRALPPWRKAEMLSAVTPRCVSPDDWLHQQQFERSRRIALLNEPGSEVELASPEDVVMHKLRWYRMSEGVSDRQWRDILGVPKVQGEGLDRGYLASTAQELGLADLLARALTEAGTA